LGEAGEGGGWWACVHACVRACVVCGGRVFGGIQFRRALPRCAPEPPEHICLSWTLPCNTCTQAHAHLYRGATISHQWPARGANGGDFFVRAAGRGGALFSFKPNEQTAGAAPGAPIRRAAVGCVKSVQSNSSASHPGARNAARWRRSRARTAPKRRATAPGRAGRPQTKRAGRDPPPCSARAEPAANEYIAAVSAPMAVGWVKNM
jgi:hypothetical protein